MMFLGQTGEMTVRLAGLRDGYYHDDRGGAFRHTPEGLRDQRRYLIRTPLRVGTQWKSVVSASAVEHYEIVSVGERCESEAGSFPDCLVVDASVRRDADVTLHIRWTWARGIGLMKVETEVELKGQGRRPQTRQSLIRYALPSAEHDGDLVSGGSGGEGGGAAEGPGAVDAGAEGSGAEGPGAVDAGAEGSGAEGGVSPPWTR